MTKGLSAGGFKSDLKYGLGREAALNGAITGNVEVKSDRQATRTGNIYVEFEFKGKPSGINNTDADFWAYELANDVWLIMRTNRLREMVHHVMKSGHVKGGDYNNSKGVLLKVSDIWEEIRKGS